MGSLARYLQEEFARRCPVGWAARREVALLPRELERVLGYAPRADVLLERKDGGRRLWIEFEVSRADPVANHAKFATAHLFQPQAETDVFVAMVSAHVARGRRNLAANTVSLMRQVGMRAFQTVLLPELGAAEVQRLNQLPRGAAGLPLVEGEIERALAVSEPVTSAAGHRIHLAGDLLDVLLNVREWNRAVATGEGRALWGTRTVTYFVRDPHSDEYAPAKFCAYLPIEEPGDGMRGRGWSEGGGRLPMTLGLYATLDGTDSRFDGHRAQTHLVRGLAMRAVSGGEAPTSFRGWLRRHEGSVRMHPSGLIMLEPPGWFR